MAVEANIRIGAQGLDAIKRGVNAAANAFGKLGITGSKAARLLTADLRTMMPVLSGLVPKMNGLYYAMGGIGVGAAAKKVMDFNRRLAQLKADANYGETEIQALKTSIEEMAAASGKMPEEIGAAYRVFMDFGGQMNFAKDSMKDLVLFSKATATPMSETAQIAATLSGNLKMSKQEVVEALSTMNELGKAGQMALTDVSANLPQILAAGGPKGFTGMRGVTQLGAAHQIIAKSYGTGEEAARVSRTALDAMLRDLTAQSKKLKGLGIQVFDKKGTMQDLDVIMEAVLKKTKGDPRMLAKIFTADSQKAAAAFADAADKSKLSDDVRKLFAVRGTKEDLVTAFNRATTGIGASVDKWDKATAKFTAGLQEHGANILGFVADNPMTVAGGAAGGFLALKILPSIVKSLFTRGGGGLAETAKGFLGAGKVQEVFVTNWQGAGGPDHANPIGPNPVAGGAGGASWLAKGGMLLGAGAAGYAFGTAIDQATGASGKLSSWANSGNQDAAHKRAAEASKGYLTSNLVQQARTYADLASKGVKSVGLSGGGSMVLTQENVVKYLAAKAKAEGMSADQQTDFLTQLKTALRDAPIVVQVKPAAGIDKVDAQASRGTKQ